MNWVRNVLMIKSLIKTLLLIDASNAASFIDHIAVSNSLYDSMHSVNVLDSGINFSDHCPVAIECTVPVSAPLRTAKFHYLHHRQHQVSFRWNKGNLHQYYSLTGNFLDDIQAPFSVDQLSP